MKLELSAGFALDIEAAEGELPGRTISGIAAPYNTTAVVGSSSGPGVKVQFAVGSLPIQGKAPKLMMYHDSTQPVGLVTSRTETPHGMMFTARIAATAAGDEALQLAKEGVLDNVSVGVNVTDSYTAEDGTMIITAADWTELSLVPTPAFSGATITSVTAQSDTLPDEEIEPTESVEENEMSEVIEASAPEAVPTNPVWATPKKAFAMPTPGEYMAAYNIGGATFARVNEAIKANTITSAFTAAALEQDVLSDVPGTLPTPVMGNLFQSYNYLRPVVSAFGARALPSGNGFSFIRPTIQQHTISGIQSPDGSDVASQTMILKANQVDRITVGGGVFISAQVMDFTSPQAQGLILQDLAGQYMKQTETIACGALEAAATTSGATWTVGANDTASLLSALYTAAYNISIDTNLFGTTLVVDPLTWKYLGSATNDVGSPVFPAVGAPGLNGQNTLGAGDASKWSGMNPMGLDIVVSGNLSANTMLVCHAPAVEFYETLRGIMSVDNPQKIGRDYSYSGTFASFMQTIETQTDSVFVQSIVVDD